jgi:hypothetical protein
MNNDATDLATIRSRLKHGLPLTVEQRRECQPFIDAAKDVVSAFEKHGVGPEFPELQTAIEKMQAAFEGSVWSR